MSKLLYLQRSILSSFDSNRFRCPNCGHDHANVVDRKYLITSLRRCKKCDMLFRTPTDDPMRNAKYYDEEYTQGFTTEMPSEESIKELKERNFAGTEKDYGEYIRLLGNVGLSKGSRIFDFGCSWGYGSYQLARSGFSVLAFEVAKDRKKYAQEKLDVEMLESMEDIDRRGLGERFDCFFSAHVLEHVPSPSAVFGYAMRMLKPGGVFVSFTPNGGAAYRSLSINWSKLWGEVHPNFIDEVFLDSSFRNSRRAVGSTPPTMIASLPDKNEMRRINNVDGYELFFVAEKVGQSW